MLRNIPNKNTRHIYTWNPDLETFQHLPLHEKIMALNEAVLRCQLHFQDHTDNDERAICLIIAPDLIFSGANGIVYSYDDNEDMKYRISLMQMTLDSRVLVFAGSIEYLTEKQDYYKNTAYVISNNSIRFYSKKESSGDIIHKGKAIPLAKFQGSGIFEFNGVRIGLEICKDHDVGTLKQEVGEGCVDVHVLISNGQNIRSHHIAADPRKNGTFVICELEPGRTIDESKTSEKSACYSLKPSSTCTDTSRQKFFYSLPQSVTALREAEPQTVWEDVSLSVCEPKGTIRIHQIKPF